MTVPKNSVHMAIKRGQKSAILAICILSAIFIDTIAARMGLFSEATADHFLVRLFAIKPNDDGALYILGIMILINGAGYLAASFWHKLRALAR